MAGAAALPGILIAATVDLLAQGSRVYADGLVRMGSRMTLFEALTGESVDGLSC